MPLYAYAGTIPRDYTETRDAAGVIVGTVAAGDERDLEQAPDQFWLPASSGKAPRASKTGTSAAADGSADAQGE